jgi:glycosyltransferase involved in cell wall biosynthesis
MSEGSRPGARPGRPGDKPRILFVAANHPAIRPGGAEGYALEVYEGIRDEGEFEAVFMARSGPPFSIASRHHEGRPITLVNDDPCQYLFYTDAMGYDWLNGRSPHKSALTRFFRDFLLEQQPDMVHFQQTMFLGYDILRVTRNTLPDVPIVYTLHEYLPICHRDGQMIRTGTNQLCRESSPRRCHECFPDVSQQAFFMRERFIKSHLELVDLFVTPSAYTLERYVDWGIPREKIRHAPHGRPPVSPLPGDRRRKRNRFGFFGQFTAYKGADVLLRAMERLGEDFDGLLRIHGANLETAPEEFQTEFQELLDDASETVTLVGQYQPKELSKLMAQVDWVVVPSIWWETGPLTVLEAFQHGRPVICSDMGGMSEKVTDGVNGIYFRRGDPDSLADAMRRAVGTRGLWDELRRGIPPVQTMREHVESLAAHYRGLLAARRSPGPDARAESEVLSHA